LNFWASWCPPCVAELPLLDRAARELDGEVHVVLLNVGEPHGTVAPFLDQLGVTAPIVLRDARDDERPLPDGVVPSRSVAQVYQTFGLPTSLLLDRQGVIRARVSGPVDEAGLTALLRRVDVVW
jgi:cytochrome c biogenesis protein CcmG, thiol:disulfide interchange protein DsbE